MTLGRGLAILVDELNKNVLDEQLKDEVILLITMYSAYVIE